LFNAFYEGREFQKIVLLLRSGRNSGKNERTKLGWVIKVWSYFLSR